MKVYTLVLVLLFFIPLALSSQSQAIWIKGKVVDSKTGEPLPNVNIRVKDSYRGTLSDQFGSFKIAIYKLPSTLIFSHVGFYHFEKVINVEPLQKLEIRLVQKIEELKEFVITSNKIDTIYISRRYSVLDYELIKDQILLLIFRNNLNHAELLLLDENNHEISALEMLPEKPLQLFKDCFGNVHMVSKTKVYQIFQGKEKMILYPSVDRELFEEVMGNCEFIVGNRMYYQNYEFQNLITNYYYIDTAQNKSMLFRTILDQSKADYLASNPEFIEGVDLVGTRQMGKINSVELREMWLWDVEQRFHHMAYLSPVFSPMEKIGDSIYIFNHPQSIIEIYNEHDSLLGETPIEYHQSRLKNTATLTRAFYKPTKWQKEIYVDDIDRRAYTLFININGTKELKEIDLKTGRLKLSMTIPFPYVEKLQIRNGFVYFLYKGWGEIQKKKLFRQSIR